MSAREKEAYHLRLSGAVGLVVFLLVCMLAGVVYSADYLVIDDMESYENDNRHIFETWLDGCGDVNGVGGNGTGSCVDLGTDIVHGGQQAMLYAYDNIAIFHDPSYSEAARRWTTPQDWTAGGVKSLTLWFYGQVGNALDELWVLLDHPDSTAVVYYDGDPNDIATEQWHRWDIALSDFNDMGVDLSRIEWLIIGFGDRRDIGIPGGEGVVYFDDIRLYVPSIEAQNSNPYDGRTEVPHEALLEWEGHDAAVWHDVYVGEDFDDVNDANTATMGIYRGRQSVDSNSYAGGEFVLERTYYWRIDEVNDTNVWKGRVWQFTVADNIILDDFEQYGLDEPKILDTWIDGWDNDTGSSIDLAFAPSDPVYGGDQSMVFVYQNNVDYGMGYYSEAELPFEGGMDWTHDGVKIVRLYFYGDPLNDAGSTEEPYFGIDDGTTYAESRYTVTGGGGHQISNLQEAEWHQWDIIISDLSGPTMTNVRSLYVGFGNRGGSSIGGLGVVYFDEIRLYRPRCIPELGPDYDWSYNCIVDLADVGIMGDEWLKTDALLDVAAPLIGPVAHWELDDSGIIATDSSGNYNHGILDGEYSWVSGKVGSGAVEFTGDGGRVWVPHSAELMPSSAVSVTAWINPAATVPYPARVLAKGIDAGDWEAYHMLFSDEQQVGWYIRDPNHSNHSVNSGDLGLSEWIHVAGTYDGDALRLYINGQLEDEDNTGGLSILQDRNELSIGNASDFNDRGFIGKIDDVRIYDYGLSAHEVAYIATAPSHNGYIPLDSQVNIYNEEPWGEKAVNFRDFAKLMDYWLEEKLWPQ